MEEETNGATPPDTSHMLMEMMVTMRRHNEERAKEFRRAQEEFKRESMQARERMEESVRL